MPALYLLQMMKNESKTLYIPLYGKAFVSRKGIILEDKKAEEIWEKEKFPIGGKSKSKWLAYFMGMRSAVIDSWLSEKLSEKPESLVLHIGCGLDSRIERVKASYKNWFDVDFPEVIEIRKEYFSETEKYKMLGASASETEWIFAIPESENILVVLEGISMYLKNEQLNAFLKALSEKYKSLSIFVDVYTVWGARLLNIKILSMMWELQWYGG